MYESGDPPATPIEPSLVSDATADPGSFHDVFVSYASQDAAIANAIVIDLERSGLKCWIAPRDVAPGAQYADGIIRAINGAKVVVLILSKNAVSSPHVGKEIERASAKQRPIIALRSDATPLTPALEYFLSESQWIDFGVGGTGAISARLIEALQRFIAHPPAPGSLNAASSAKGAPPAQIGKPAAPGFNRTFVAVIAIGALGLAYFVADKVWLSKRGTVAVTQSVEPSPQAAAGPSPVNAGGATAAFAPPAHSIAVLPFVNMSGDPKQDYFSDGLSEELLNSLTTIRDLRVAARTSSFFFKGKEVDLSEIAHKLNVGAVLEGSVRKDGGHVRITAQLIDAMTGFHLWSQTYDRDLKDVLSLQTEIATAVTKALQATLMADAAAAIELGGTQNPQAFDAYLRGKNQDRVNLDRNTVLASIAAFDEAIRLDPAFAKAYAGKALAETGFAEYYGTGAEIREHFQRARSAAERSLQLAPQLGEAHSAFAVVLANGFLDFKGALAEHQRALGFSPNDSGVLLRAAWLFADIGRADEAATMARRGASLDQLNWRAYRSLTVVLSDARKYPEAIEAANRSLALNPNDSRQVALRGLAQLQLGDVDAARQSCEKAQVDWESQLCLAIAYNKLHRQPDAEKQLAAMTADLGEASAFQYAEIHAQWGDLAKALDWIETAYRLKDPGMIALKADDFLNPLRKEPRFQEIEHKLNLPD